MKIEFRFKRSADWIRAERLRTGENVPETGTVDIDVADLAPSTRELLLAAGNGEYVSPFNYLPAHRETAEISRWATTGIALQIDSYADAVTAADFDVAIGVAEEQRQTLVAERRAKLAEERRLAAAKAAEEQAIADARKLLADDLRSKDQLIDSLRERVSILSEALRAVDLDALRDMVDRTRANQTAESREDDIEGAAEVWIFQERDDAAS